MKFSVTDVNSLGSLSKQQWDRIAEDYYSPSHVTTRNFDAIIDTYLSRFLCRINLEGYVLEVGGGSGRLQKLVAVGLDKHVVGDISIPMMKALPQTNRLARYVQMSAFYCPFRDCEFDAIISTLGDSFFREESFAEFYRILKQGGAFLLASPSAVWGRTLRPAIGIGLNETIIPNKSQGELRVPSFLYDEDELKKILLQVGFQAVETESFNAAGIITDDADFSPHVVIVGRLLKLPPARVPLVTVALAFKK